MDGSICTSFTHPSRFRLSRFGTSPKSGILIRFLEWLKSRALKLGRYCERPTKVETLSLFCNLPSTKDGKKIIL
jgi:hypothetical protein